MDHSKPRLPSSEELDHAITFYVEWLASQTHNWRDMGKSAGCDHSTLFSIVRKYKQSGKPGNFAAHNLAGIARAYEMVQRRARLRELHQRFIIDPENTDDGSGRKSSDETIPQ